MIIVIVFYPIMIILYHTLVDLVIIRLFVIMSWYYVKQRLQCAVTRGFFSSYSEGITKITTSILDITSVSVFSFSPCLTLKCIAVLSVSFIFIFHLVGVFCTFHSLTTEVYICICLLNI